MTPSDEPEPDRTPRRTRLAVLLVTLGFLALAAVCGPLVGKLSSVADNNQSDFLPAGAESVQVSRIAAEMNDTPGAPFLTVITARSGEPLTAEQQAAVVSFARASANWKIAGQPLRSYLEGPVVPQPSADRKAMLVIHTADPDRLGDEVTTQTDYSSESTTDSVANAIAAQLRAHIQHDLAPAGLDGHVTGLGGFLADLSKAFAGIDGLLLGAALAVVFVILLIVYRSPILPIAVLISAIVGLSIAAAAVYFLAREGVIKLDGQSQGIMFILVVGAATDYALLLVARYKEELHNHAAPSRAMRLAWRRVLEPVLASASTVAIALLCLLVSRLGNTKGLGPVGALGIAGAVIAALGFLPAVLVLFGRRIFWPFIPKLDHKHDEDVLGTRNIWGRVAGLIKNKPRATWVLTFAVLAACTAFMPTFNKDGARTVDIFRDRVDSVVGSEVLEQHFPGGTAQPVLIVAPAAKAAQALETIRAEPGVASAARPPAPPQNGRVMLTAELRDAGESKAAHDVIRSLRASLDPVSPDILVGGETASLVDSKHYQNVDLVTIIPIVLLVIAVVLALLLRSLLAPLLLLLANLLSFGATIGVAALVFDHVLDLPGADPAIPLYSFVFLVALGIDYSIFLMTRVREESIRRGTRPGILVGLAVTGGVITSAGVVLAATFSALVLLPILFLLQVAFIVAFGVLLDTIVVRSLLVPALSYDIGPKIWWPNRRLADKSGPTRTPS